MGPRISDTGLSIVYEPKGKDPVLDIVLVHGLQGHPYKTWAYCKPRPETKEQRDTSPKHSKSRPQREKRGLWILNKLLGQPQVGVAKSSSADAQATQPSSVYWPADLLPSRCPDARILVWGYDTKVTKYMVSGVNKSSLFSHGKDLLFSLERERPLGRPLIFVAHSLGGIVTKEMLFSSHMSSALPVRDVVESTAAVMFLGTPHRGSIALANIANIIRKAASMTLTDTSHVALDALGLKTSDLERCQESFSSVWAAYDFRVKTFQEAMGLTGVNLGLLNNKVVPDLSSALGDIRENVEPLQANHMDMCRFYGDEDPNYLKVSGELRATYNSIIRLGSKSSGRPLHSNEIRASRSYTDTSSIKHLCLESLRFTAMDIRQRTIKAPVTGSFSWLSKHGAYMEWNDSSNPGAHRGLLQIKGKPGSGKSTLMKAAFERLKNTMLPSSHIAAAYFFNRKGSDLERTAAGLFRSLLFQILSSDLDLLHDFVSKHSHEVLGGNDKPTCPREETLRSFLSSIFEPLDGKKSQVSTRQITIFIDAIDECEATSMRDLIYFFRDLTSRANASTIRLRVCFSSRNFPAISVANCLEISLELFNDSDIALYISHKLAMTTTPTEPIQWQTLGDIIRERASGVFLWVTLVLDMLLRYRDEGENMRYIAARLNAIPQSLEDVIEELVRLAGHSVDPDNPGMVLRLFQWVLLAQAPLRVREWHHILAFIREKPPKSLQEWRQSEYYTEDDSQLERQIRNMSKGLVEVALCSQDDTLPRETQSDGEYSVHGRAASLDLESGDSRVVQVIHESVREYFINGDGFRTLQPSLNSRVDGIGRAHVTIMVTCLRYAMISELDRYSAARLRLFRGLVPDDSLNEPRNEYEPEYRSEHGSEGHTASPIPSKRPSRSQSVASFSSAGSNYRNSRSWLRLADEATSELLDLQPFEGEKDITAKERTTSHWVKFADESLPPDENKSVVTRNSSTSQSVYSQTLEDTPFLLLYATGMFTTHAILAEKLQVAPDRVISRLQNENTWKRWASLQDGISGHTISQYVAKYGLTSWFKFLLRSGHDSCELFCAYAALRNQKMSASVVLYEAGHPCLGEQQSTLRLLLPNKDGPTDGARKLSDFLWHIIAETFEDTTTRMLLISRTLWQTKLLHYAVAHAKQEIAIKLLDLGVDVDIEDSDGRTVLGCVCKDGPSLLGRNDMIEILLRRGAKVNHQDTTGSTALHYLFRRTRFVYEPTLREVVMLLLSLGAGVTISDATGCTPLHLASQCRDWCIAPSILELLLQHCGNPDVQDSAGSTPLHRASEVGNTRNVTALLNHGATVDSRDKKGMTPLHLACFSPDPQSERCYLANLDTVLTELLAHGADVNASDHEGNTPLVYASNGSSTYTLRAKLRRCLLQAGAREVTSDQEGHSTIASAPTNAREPEPSENGQQDGQQDTEAEVGRGWFPDGPDSSRFVLGVIMLQASGVV